LTKLYRKPTDRQSYLNNKSYHPTSTKRGIPYSQALRMKRICTEQEELKKNLDHLNSTLLSKGYVENHIDTQFQKVLNTEREETLQYKTKNQLKHRIPLILTYNKQLPNFKSVIDKNWSLLQIDEKTSAAFKEKPIIAYRRNKNLRNLIGQTTIKHSKVERKRNISNGRCKPCNSRPGNLCCKQIANTDTFQSNITKQNFKIFHNTNCKSAYVIYLLDCLKCKIQYIGKAETAFYLRLNNHRKDSKQTRNVIPASAHFNQVNHNFNPIQIRPFGGSQ